MVSLSFGIGETNRLQGIMFDEEQLNPHGDNNLPHVLTKKKIRCPHFHSEEELSACITDVLTKFQSIS